MAAKAMATTPAINATHSKFLVMDIANPPLPTKYGEEALSAEELSLGSKANQDNREFERSSQKRKSLRAPHWASALRKTSLAS